MKKKELYLDKVLNDLISETTFTPSGMIYKIPYSKVSTPYPVHVLTINDTWWLRVIDIFGLSDKESKYIFNKWKKHVTLFLKQTPHYEK